MILASWRDGWRRVLAAPAIVAGVFALTFVLAVPLAITMRGILQSLLRDSLVANQVADGIDYDWWQELSWQASGLGETFSPTIIGFAATLDNISSVVDREVEAAPVAGALAIYLAGWTFISGGILDRYARQRPTRAAGFFAACGVYFFRFARLSVLSGLVYWWLFKYVHQWLFGELFTNITRGVSVERDAFLWRFGFYAIFGALLLVTNLLFDYAKVRTVVEDRRSVIGATRAAARFVARHPRQVLGLYALNALTFLVVLAIWAAIAPAAPRAGLSVLFVFLLGQLYLLARLLLKLQFLASQTTMFQANLAHAQYTAAPVRAWPDSPAVETIARVVSTPER